MGCCGGGHNQYNQKHKDIDVKHNDNQETGGKINLMFLVGGLLTLGLLAVYFIK